MMTQDEFLSFSSLMIDFVTQRLEYSTRRFLLFISPTIFITTFITIIVITIDDIFAESQETEGKKNQR